MTSTLQLLQRFTSEIIRGLRSIVMLPYYLHQVVIGQLLGDSHGSRSSATSNTRLEWSFGAPYRDYAYWVYGLFSQFCQTGVTTLPSGQFRLKTLSLGVFNQYHNMFYVMGADGEWIKVVPAMIKDLMTPVVLAHLIMSDGSYDIANSTVFIYVNSYTHADCVRLAAAITAMGIPTTVRADRYGKDGQKQYKLAITKTHHKALQAMLTPHMHESMLYRLGPRVDLN